MPIYCPLVFDNKSKIISDAKNANTYEKSICNSNDCCTAFLPKNVTLSANKNYVKSVVNEIDYNEYISIEKIELV